MSYVRDTIAAISTAPGQGAIAVLRVSGAEARAVANSLFEGKTAVTRVEPRRQYFGAICEADGTVVDRVLLTVFAGPASYTGEDLVEISCHGGVLVTQRILDLLLSRGARAAEPGEFTQRAFLNGKMDLTQAEAVMDLISAQTSLALRAANEQLEGRIGEQMNRCREELLEILAHIEAYIDFPEEDIDPDTGASLRRRMADVQGILDQLLSTADQGRILREGVRTVICGAPNVGKSSLLNVLLGFERAIVSDTAGTTRDTIEETIQIKGLPIRLIDTAGVRRSEDSIEREGIQRAERQMENADLILEIVDGSRPPGDRLQVPGEFGGKRLLILNKADLGVDGHWNESRGIPFSCKEQTGIAELQEAVFGSMAGGMGDGSGSLIAINSRHKASLSKARNYLGAAIAALDAGQSPEFVALEIRSSLEGIGEVVGRVDAEELLGVIFGSFCIGK